MSLYLSIFKGSCYCFACRNVGSDIFTFNMPITFFSIVHHIIYMFGFIILIYVMQPLCTLLMQTVFQCFYGRIKLLLSLYSGDAFQCFVQLGSIADRTIAEADSDGDGLIAFDEFVKVRFTFRFCLFIYRYYYSSFLY